MFWLMDGESIFIWGSGVVAISDGFAYDRSGERACVVIKFMLPVIEPQYFSSVRVVSVWPWSCEMFYKVCGNLAAV